MLIPKENIIPDPNNPRKTFDPELLSGLRDSMGGGGPDQPLIVRPTADGKYMIVTGERRWRACVAEEIECVVRELSDRESLETQIREDLQHEDIGDIELGAALHEHMSKYGTTQEAVGRIIGRTATDVSKYISIFLNLSAPCKELYREGRFKFGTAWQLSTLPNSLKQLEIANEVIENNLDVKQATRIVQEAKAHPMKPISEATYEAIKGKDSAKADKAISSIPEPERREETRRALDAYDVPPKLASEVAEKVVSQPERSPQEIIEEIQEAGGASKRALATWKQKDDLSKCIQVTKQMESMSGRLAEFKDLPFKDLPSEKAEGFRTELQNLITTASEALERLRSSGKTTDTEPEAGVAAE